MCSACWQRPKPANSYVNQYIRNGNKCSAAFQVAWDAECARWDHLKATLAGMQ